MRITLHNLALALLLSGIALAQNPAQQQDPQQMPQTQQQPTSQQEKATADVQDEIQSALRKEPSLADASINVQVTQQSVELSGTVANKDAKDKAEQIAKTHAGGLEVKNRLKIGG
jgi:osmotically-inducible protein OsmY